MRRLGYINKLLYDARIKKGLTRKEAGKALKMSSLYIKLVETGYISSISKKRQRRFINFYHLSDDFFKVNSNYIQSIAKPDEHPQQLAKSKKFVASKAIKWVSGSLVAINLAGVGYGIYCMNKTAIKPRDKWTEQFTYFRENMIKEGRQSPSIIYPGEYKVTIENDVASLYDDGETKGKVVTYTNDYNAADTSIDATYTITQEEKARSPYLHLNSQFSFYVFAYNKKKIAAISLTQPLGTKDIVVPNATAVIDDDVTLTCRAFNYYDAEGKLQIARVGDQIHTEFSQTFGFYMSRAYEHIDQVFVDHDLAYTRAVDLMKDLQIIARDQVLHFRMGIWFTILGCVFAVGFGILLALSFYFYYQHKKRGTYMPYISREKMPKALILSSFKKYSRDQTSFKLFIPEFVLTVMGLIILLVSAFSVYLSVGIFFKGNVWGITNAAPWKAFSTNMLSAGVMLLFFVRMDVNTHKTIRQLLISIFIFMFGGLALYIAEVVIFRSFAFNNTIFDYVFNGIVEIIPGNFVWPLGLSAMMFLFLFTSPGRIKYNRKKMTTYRCMATIPGVILVFNLLWQFVIKWRVNAPYYVRFLFFSKGGMITIFMLAYILGMYAWQAYCRKHLGYKLTTDVFFNSKRYCIQKNMIASIILLILLIVDLIIGYTSTSNAMSMGTNWAVGIIIPFVLFYQPHLGPRNAKWDLSAGLMKALFSIGGYAGAIILVLTMMGFGEIMFIIN